MVKFGERKKQTQDYEITIVVQADVTVQSPKEWLPSALQEGEFKYKVIKLYSTDVTPIDRDNPEYKYLDDLDSLEE